MPAFTAKEKMLKLSNVGNIFLFSMLIVIYFTP